MKDICITKVIFRKSNIMKLTTFLLTDDAKGSCKDHREVF